MGCFPLLIANCRMFPDSISAPSVVSSQFHSYVQFYPSLPGFHRDDVIYVRWLSDSCICNKCVLLQIPATSFQIQNRYNYTTLSVTVPITTDSSATHLNSTYSTSKTIHWGSRVVSYTNRLRISSELLVSPPQPLTWHTFLDNAFTISGMLLQSDHIAYIALYITKR